MRLLLSVIVSACVLLLLDKRLKKYSTWFYYGAAALAAFSYWIPKDILPGGIAEFLTNYMTSGTLPAALFVIVMYAVLMPQKSRLMKCFMGSRGEIAIIASLLILNHIVYYGMHFIRQIFVLKRGLSISDWATVVIAVIFVVLLVPLTVTSFKKIRKKMQPRSWKKLQRWSYLFYGLIYLHVIVVIYPDIVHGDMLRVADFYCYTAVFGCYAALRIGKFLQKKKLEKYYPAVWTAVCVLIIAESALMMPKAYDAFTTAARNTGDEKIRETEDESSSEDESEKALTESSEQDMLVNERIYADGSWFGEGMGFDGMIKVEVVIENGVITKVKAIDYIDEDPYFTDARVGVTAQVLEKQNADVDVVSGATYSSEGLREAIGKALKEAEAALQGVTDAEEADIEQKETEETGETVLNSSTVSSEAFDETDETAVNVVMGTQVSAHVYGAEGMAQNIIDKMFELEENYLSWRIEGSEIFCLNQSAGEEEGYQPSKLLMTYLEGAAELARKSDGAFDFTIGKISNLWKLGEEGARIPAKEEIEELLPNTGYEKVTIEGESVYLLEGVSVDFGAIGKGIGAQEAKELLENSNAKGAVVAVGGSIQLYGEKPDGSPWKVAITNPREERGGDCLGVLTLEGDYAISTSGDYEKYLMEDGVRYHHILDPETGYPANNGLISVTVVCQDGWLSDGLSTACFVLGQEKGMELVKTYGAEAIFVNENYEVTITDGLKDIFTINKTAGNYYESFIAEGNLNSGMPKRG